MNKSITESLRKQIMNLEAKISVDTDTLIYLKNRLLELEKGTAQEVTGYDGSYKQLLQE